MMTKYKSLFYTFLDLFVLIGIPLGLWFSFIYAPVEMKMGAVQKIFYFHVASAWIGFFSFFITFIASIFYLIKPDLKYDDIASSSAGLGLVFSTIVLVTGPLWAKPVWGVWWSWDPRLTSTLVLWFIYCGYFFIRKFIDGIERRAKLSAVMGIIGFVDVPVVFFSIRLWRGMHPNVLQKGGGGLHPDMMTSLMISLFIFSLLYLSLLIKGIRLNRIERKINELEMK